ncbi:hypothetical protein D0C36_07290 [Mucilaginibacter conchicola]|uniref:Uncharacterized protein n=1 Tax=Mucilaginibacter conchicola TaxID=2303333 RepID=A0A372NYY8_9SPHI|nr:DUF6263 family protein [Mucilaginibacter conchicola]RFZ95325.1 hypothetical protein D0C36_07290 [Mucilaginibacter conchicola]
MKKILTLLLLATTTVAFAQPKKLELNLQKDSTYYLTTNGKLDIDQTIQGAHQLIKTTIKGRMSHKVTSIKDTLYNIEVAYKSIGMEMEIQGKTLSFDSEAADSSNIFSRVMKSIVNKPFDLVLSKRGEIVTIKNTQNLFKNIFDGLPPIPEEKKTQLLAQLQQSFGDKAIRGNFQESFIVFPKTPIALKGSWTSRTFLETGAISAKTNTRYVLNNITDDGYEISGDAIVVPGAPAEFKNGNGYFMRMSNVSGTTKTIVKIDKQTGWILESQVVKAIKGTMQVKQTLAGPIAMTMPMTVNAILHTNHD